jgi:PilZ domain
LKGVVFQIRDSKLTPQQITLSQVLKSRNATVPADRRKDSRRKLDQPCWIDAGPGLPPNKGQLCDVSPSGARLICEDSVELPDQFNLYMTHDGSVGRKCKVVRRADNEIGLRFLSRKVPKPHWLAAMAPRSV